jgi:hypothetical protein
MNLFRKAFGDLADLRKGPYGPAHMGLYSETDNARRKMGRTSEEVPAGPNKAVHATKPTASMQATALASEASRKSKQNPVKHYTPAEIARLFRSRMKTKV